MEGMYSLIEGTPVIHLMKWLTKTSKTASFPVRDAELQNSCFKLLIERTVLLK
jgi:hypothetical protein